jgi:hypothetical protein
MGFGLVIGFTELLKLITTSKDYALTVLHTSQITIGHTRFSQSVTVFTSCCSVAASTEDVPLLLSSRTVSSLSYQLLSQQQLTTTEHQWLSNSSH